MAPMIADKPVKKVKLFDKRVDFSGPVGDQTLRQFFGKVSTVGKVTKSLWKAYKTQGLLLD